MADAEMRPVVPLRPERLLLRQQSATGSPILQNLGDPLARLAVAIGIDPGSHPMVGLFVFEQLLDMTDDGVRSCADNAREPGLRSLRPLCCFAEYEHWYTQRRRFLLDPSRIREDQIGTAHVGEKRKITK